MLNMGKFESSCSNSSNDGNDNLSYELRLNFMEVFPFINLKLDSEVLVLIPCHLSYISFSFQLSL